jgi:hypothetical protein
MIAHRVFLTHNPWQELVPNGVLLRELETAACLASEQWEEWQAAGEIEEGRDSFAAVLLDPTRPRWVKEVGDLVYAIILFGPNAEAFIPNAASKADAHERHGLNMGALVGNRNLCLADGEFAYGNSAEVNRTIGGGSGLSVMQDGELVKTILVSVSEAVIAIRKNFIAEQRRLHGAWRWFSADNQPDSAYTNVVDLLGASGTLTTEAAE